MNLEELKEKERAYKEGIRNKILNGEELTEREVQDIVYEDLCGYVGYVDEITLEECGQYDKVDMIIQVDKNYYCISYNRVANEFQEDEFFPQVATKMKRRIVVKYEYVWEVDNE